MKEFNYKQRPITHDYEKGYERIFDKKSLCCRAKVVVKGNNIILCTKCKKVCDVA